MLTNTFYCIVICTGSGLNLKFGLGTLEMGISTIIIARRSPSGRAFLNKIREQSF
jgi:hypothetical protein